jgi:hypothetical protein
MSLQELEDIIIQQQMTNNKSKKKGITWLICPKISEEEQ